MLCLEVTLNDEEAVIAGAMDAQAISAAVDLFPEIESVHLKLFGEVISGTAIADANWLTRPLGIGDRVSIRLVDTDAPAAPKLSRSDPSVQADDSVPYVCSFCAKSAIEVERMMKSQKAMICNECIDFMHEDWQKDAK